MKHNAAVLMISGREKYYLKLWIFFIIIGITNTIILSLFMILTMFTQKKILVFTKLNIQT